MRTARLSGIGSGSRPGHSRSRHRASRSAAHACVGALLLGSVVLLPPGSALAEGDETGERVIEEPLARPAGDPGLEHPEDPLKQIVQRVATALHRLEVDGVSRDPRPLDPVSEEIRLSVVPQLLGFAELYRIQPLEPLYADIVERADFLIARIPAITSGSAFDGMLGYGLLTAYEVTRDPRYLQAAVPIVNRCLSLTGARNTLNWGLMSCMALAKYSALTGSQAARQKTLQILATLPPYQLPDGSFPHVCPGASDIHYTAWMAMELAVVGRYTESSLVPLMLGGARDFLRTRIGSDGLTVYEEPCGPSCRKYYYSRASGCWVDYDTRAWINELGYTALIFDAFDAEPYHVLMGRLLDFEDQGLFGDKWDWFPLPGDPIAPWVGNPSVIRTSVIFWSLAWILAERGAPWPRRYDDLASVGSIPAEDAVGPVPWPAESLIVAWRETREVGSALAGDAAIGATTAARGQSGFSAYGDDGREIPGRFAIERIHPNPVRSSTVFRVALAAPARLSLEIYDPQGRRVRALANRAFGAGRHDVGWDGRDDAGVLVGSGVYIVRLDNSSEVRVARVAVIR